MKNFLLILVQFLIISSATSSTIPQDLLEIQLICEHSHWFEADWAIKRFPEEFKNPDTSKHYIKCILPPGVRKEEKVKIVGAKFPNKAHADFLAQNPDIPKILFFQEEDLTELMPFGISDVFTNIISLKMSGKGLKTITRENFAGFNDLKVLEIGSNKLKSIPVDAFYDLPNLEDLSITRCGLTKLDEDLFINNPKLKILEAAFNDIDVLPAQIFRNNPLIESVNFYYSNIKDNQVDFSKFKNLKKTNFEKSPDYDNESDDY